MSVIAEHLVSELLLLPLQERAAVAQRLLESLDEEATGLDDEAFDTELAKRAEDIQSGRVIGISAEELFARLDERLSSLAR